MLRATLNGLTVMFFALACQPTEVLAAGRSSGVGARAVSAHHGAQPRLHGRGFESGRAHGFGRQRYARHQGGFYGGPPPYGYDPTIRAPAEVYEVEVERPRPVDPFAFANLPVRAGIPYPPKPEPTLYRIEGRRDRPVTRAIGIVEMQAGGRWTRQTTRYVHAGTGALVLSVPGR